MRKPAESLVGDILLFVLCVAAPVCFSETVDLTILQSTDIHGSPAVAKFLPWIAAERQKEPELLLVDCGDPRLLNRHVDIGCYEVPVTGLMLLVR